MVRNGFIAIAMVITTMVISGCFKPESPHLIEDTFTIDLELNQNAPAQYVNFTNRTVTTATAPIPWHIRFACNSGDFRVEINSAAGIAGHRVNNLGYEEVNESYPVDKIIWDFDLPGQPIESTVIGAWGDFSFAEPKSLKDIILLKVPINNDELILKLQIMGVENDRYHVQTSLLDNSVRDTFYVARSTHSNYRYINLLERVDIEFEPAKSDWDFVFTHFVDTTIDGQSPNNPYVESLNSYLSIYPGLISNTSEVVWTELSNALPPDSIQFNIVQGQSYYEKPNLTDAQTLSLNQKGRPVRFEENGFLVKKRNEDKYFYIYIDEYHIESVGKSGVSMTIKSL